MYSFTTSLHFNNSKSLLESSTLKEKLNKLKEDPIKISKATGLTIGDYYCNCGNRYCIIFNINEGTHVIHLLLIWNRAKLHKFIKGWYPK